MDALLRKCAEIPYGELDIDEVLDQRELPVFDREWMRVYRAVEVLKKARPIFDNQSIREKAYRLVYAQSSSAGLAGYISDDFGLIADSKLLNYWDPWLSKLIACYESARIPQGEL